MGWWMTWESGRFHSTGHRNESNGARERIEGVNGLKSVNETETMNELRETNKMSELTEMSVKSKLNEDEIDERIARNGTGQICFFMLRTLQTQKPTHAENAQRQFHRMIFVFHQFNISGCSEYLPKSFANKLQTRCRKKTTDDCAAYNKGERMNWVKNFH